SPAELPSGRATHSALPTASAPQAVEAKPTDLEPTVVVSSPATLRALEKRGFDLGSQLAGRAAHSNDALLALAPYQVLSTTLASDLESDRQRDPRAGVGMRHAHRQFDVRWLSSPKMRFELIAIANRTDRRIFAVEHCGEIRFVYRLAYEVATAT